MTTKRSVEMMFDLPAGAFCGVLLRKRLMKRVLKLQNEYERKLKELLAANLDELEVQNWTLNDNREETGKQISGKYFMKNESDEEKLKRIEVFRLSKAEKAGLLFEVDAEDKVQAMKEISKELDAIAESRMEDEK